MFLLLLYFQGFYPLVPNNLQYNSQTSNREECTLRLRITTIKIKRTFVLKSKTAQCVNKKQNT